MAAVRRATSRHARDSVLSRLVVRNVDDLLMEVGVGEQRGRSVSGGGVGEFGVGAACLLDDGDKRGNVPGAGPEQEERVELSRGDQQSAVASSSARGGLTDRAE